MALNLRRDLTYSPAFTLVPTNECFNRCTYCNFRRDAIQADWLSLEEAQRQLHQLKGTGVCEILILSGEVHPRSARRSDWLNHIVSLCQLVLNEGFLPHSNVGPLSFQEMAIMGTVNVSMGLMLEQLNSTLTQTVHTHAPSKDPALRLQQLHWAGELQIPFTTGLLLGIGESRLDWSVGLEAIAQAQETWGHIQEVILQPYQPGSLEGLPQPPFSDRQMLDAVTLARAILPESITIQIPPNLIRNTEMLLSCLDQGVRDLGGIVPHDHVNPDYAHRDLVWLKDQVERRGYSLKPRLPIYPSHDPLLSPPLRAAVQPWRSGQNKIGYEDGALSRLESFSPQGT